LRCMHPRSGGLPGNQEQHLGPEPDDRARFMGRGRGGEPSRTQGAGANLGNKTVCSGQDGSLASACPPP
jgi:hypothetical protein